MTADATQTNAINSKPQHKLQHMLATLNTYLAICA
jgi:hypothetical protein